MSSMSKRHSLFISAMKNLDILGLHKFICDIHLELGNICEPYNDYVVINLITCKLYSTAV